MSRETFHYRAAGSPVTSAMACGRGSLRLGMTSFPTSDVHAVTCKACLRMMERDPWIVTTPPKAEP